MGGNDELMTFWRQINEKDEANVFWDPKADTPSYTRRSGDRAWQQIHTGARLIPLSRNPCMGDLLCRTYRESAGQLPDSRAQLFGQFVTKMLGREAKAASRRSDIFPQAGVWRETVVIPGEFLGEGALPTEQEWEAAR